MRILSTAFGLAICVVLTGCSTSFDPPAAPYSISGGVVTGQVHGGRGPIVGAHIFLFAAGTGGQAGPGITASNANKSISLLTSSSASGYTTAMDISGNEASNPTYGDYYVTTDSNGQFALDGEYTCTQGSQVYLYSLGGNPGGPSDNDAAGLLAVLGQCPASGTMASITPTVFVSEVSTVAAAYALAGYATDATHVSSNTTPAALTGIANAFANAAMLYDISGNTNGGTANTAIPGNTSSVVAYEGINSLANSLAACVNSTGASSGQCTTDLFDAVLSNGGSGLTATDTAIEAIYIAHNPGTAVGTIFNNAAAIGTPFQPTLPSAPNDWTIGVSVEPSAGNISGLALDASGNAYVYGQKVSAISPQGVILKTFGPSTNSNGVRAAVDNAGYVWVTAYSNGALYEYYGAEATSPYTLGTLIGTYTGGDIGGPLAISFDADSNVWVADLSSLDNVSVYYGSNAVSPNSPGDALSATGFTGSGVKENRWVLFDANGYAFVGSDYGLGEFCATNPGCTFGSPISSGNIIGSYDSSNQMAIDASGDLWGLDTATSIVRFYGSGAVSPNVPGGVIGSYNGGGLNDADGLAVDGSGNIWVNNYNATNAENGDANNISEFTSAGGAISPPNGYRSSNYGFTTNQNYPAITGGSSIAVDSAGNVWVPNTWGGNVEILIGAATPVVTPVSANLVTPYGSSPVNRP